MWFHLLSVAAFLALGSCRDFYGHSRAVGGNCLGPICPCSCPHNSCPPCPVPNPPECLKGCGSPSCPCPVSLNNDYRSASSKPVKDIAPGVSTISVYPTGPICSGFNLSPNLVVTVNTCVLGKSVQDLYVTVNTKPQKTTLKVIEKIDLPYNSNEPYPFLLFTETPSKPVIHYTVPHRPISKTGSIEVHKWDVLNNGQVYKPTRTPAKSYRDCRDDGGNRLCVDTTNVTKMGWNDIGTPFAEVHGNTFIVHGLYYGADLYLDSKTIKYLPLYEYSPFIRDTIQRNNQ